MAGGYQTFGGGVSAVVGEGVPRPYGKTPLLNSGYAVFTLVVRVSEVVT